MSEGRDRGRIASFGAAVEVGGARVLDVHSDPDHHRSVLTVEGDDLPSAMAELAAAASYVDLAHHDGLHPRLGGLDVCPIVPHAASVRAAVAVAHEVGERIWQRTNLPVYFYGHASFREGTRSLPDLRRGGIAGLAERSRAGLVPDIGSPSIDVRRGVVCVGARDVLIAFNIWLDGDLDVAKQVAKKIRATEGGPPGIRALAVDSKTHGSAQVSMNLTSPDETGIEDAFVAVEEAAQQLGATALATEIVGLVPERYMPSPDAKATRLLIKPGRSLESAILS